jgi:hypothetical protein
MGCHQPAVSRMLVILFNGRMYILLNRTGPDFRPNSNRL